ncbi:DUF6911 family protein [Acinetobacter sp. MD2(2019)]|uniref:DUF6911 family protein n=1 Tax=Acinetobacter sp. MD2(2019) TaxID=2605273 RepID=UPI002D1EF2A8|nr:hypothetical protein [Acinetobacter sp. MD2(2019)]MEB3755193.1 hypothetical protein [Acinetobacter sp. MD2(2019)]
MRVRNNENEIRGGYLEKFSRIQLPLLLKPKIVDILMVLEMIKNQAGGVISLTNLEAIDEEEPESLKLYFEEDNYLLMLLDYDEEGYIYVRTLHNADAPKGEFQNILGEPYGATTVVQDFELVKKCFIEFNQTGNVSRDLLN